MIDQPELPFHPSNKPDTGLPEGLWFRCPEQLVRGGWLKVLFSSDLKVYLFLRYQEWKRGTASAALQEIADGVCLNKGNVARAVDRLIAAKLMTENRKSRNGARVFAFPLISDAPGAKDIVAHAQQTRVAQAQHVIVAPAQQPIAPARVTVRAGATIPYEDKETKKTIQIAAQSPVESSPNGWQETVISAGSKTHFPYPGVFLLAPASASKWFYCGRGANVESKIIERLLSRTVDGKAVLEFVPLSAQPNVEIAEAWKVASIRIHESGPREKQYWSCVNEMGLAKVWTRGAK